MISDKTKEFIRNWTPPVVIKSIVKLKGTDSCFKGDFSSWQEAANLCVGYDDKKILEKVLASTLKVKNGEAVYERDSVIFDHIEYAWPVTSCLMWTAARYNGRLNVIDFGGSLGSSYFQNIKFTEKLPELSWSIIEQPHYVEAGRSYIEDKYLRFYNNIDECLMDNDSNVVLLSSVLQYLPEPFKVLDEILSSGINTLIIDRTCYLNSSNISQIKIQSVTDDVYKTSYPCHFFIEKDVVKYIENRGYSLIETFDSLDNLAPFASWKGHVYLRNIDE